MKRLIFSIYAAFSLLAGISGLFGVGDKVLSIGAFSGWRDFETREALTEVSQVRPNPVLALSSANQSFIGFNASNPDLYLSFDEGSPLRFTDRRGYYDIVVSSRLGSVGGPLARQGDGAARFSTSDIVQSSSTSEEALVLWPQRGALFAPGSPIRDFSIEFWLNPSNPVNGEQILNWSSTIQAGSSDYNRQRIQCAVIRNRLQWTFSNFFLDPQGRIPASLRSITISGSPLIPGTWSHHLIRFNSEYGVLEYLVDGRQEALVYVTSTGNERGEVYTPLIGQESNFALGSRFTGLMDEFKIHSQYLETLSRTRYSSSGGRAESGTLDLGRINTQLLRLEATGGRIFGNHGNRRNEYAGSRNYSFADHSELRFFIRFSDIPHQWNMPWIPVQPGVDFPGNFKGRYAQLAVEFFPSGDGETTPYLEEIKLVYRNIEPPPPPAMVFAAAEDGAVELSWRAVANLNLGGYLVYFGTSSENYFGEQGNASPIDAGTSTSIRIEGLRNGTLYYFAVVSYDRDFLEPGTFSREIAARPQRVPDLR